MSEDEIKHIEVGLKKYGRIAYEKAKSTGHAVVMQGNSICSIDADGHKTIVSRVAKSTVRVKSRSYRLKK